MFKKKVLKTIEKYKLTDKNDNILVALSGGSDSVSLLLVLLMLKDEFSLTVEAAHVNHSLREEADSDTEFVRKLCEEKNVKLHILKENIAELSKKWGYSEEKTGRIVRYNFFEEITRDRNMKIATAHTKDDCAENFLICALRGTSPKGIPPKRENIIRPLIEITKDEIYGFLKEQNQKFVEDKTNFLPDYTRNKVRLEIIPYINEKFHTKFANNVYNSLDVSYFEDDFLTEQTKKAIGDTCIFEDFKVKIDLRKFSVLHTALKRRVLKDVYYSLNKNDGYISFEHISDILDMCEKGKTGKKLLLPKNTEACLSYGELVFLKSDKMPFAEDFEYRLKLNEKISVGELGVNVFINDCKKGIEIFSEGNEFVVRNRRPGDKIYIKNSGHKKLKDFMIDKKVPQNIRRRLVVVCDSHGIAYVENIYKRKNDVTKNNKKYIYIGE